MLREKTWTPGRSSGDPPIPGGQRRLQPIVVEQLGHLVELPGHRRNAKIGATAFGLVDSRGFRRRSLKCKADFSTVAAWTFCDMSCDMMFCMFSSYFRGKSGRDGGQMGIAGIAI